MRPEEVQDAIKSLLESDKEVAHGIWLPPICISARERKSQVVNIATDYATLGDLLRFEQCRKAEAAEKRTGEAIDRANRLSTSILALRPLMRNPKTTVSQALGGTLFDENGKALRKARRVTE